MSVGAAYTALLQQKTEKVYDELANCDLLHTKNRTAFPINIPSFIFGTDGIQWLVQQIRAILTNNVENKNSPK